jgi:hypothetical protein
MGPPMVAFTAALIALGAATIASYIQFNQWRTAKEKLRLDLYDKRMSVYNELYLALLEMPNRSDISQKELRSLHLAVNSATFLFTSEISDIVVKMFYNLEQQRLLLGQWKSEDKLGVPNRDLIEKFANRITLLSRDMDNMIAQFPGLFHETLFFGNIRR